MFPWLKEYEIFQEETFNRFLRNSGIINKNTIPQNEMVMQKAGNQVLARTSTSTL